MMMPFIPQNFCVQIADSTIRTIVTWSIKAHTRDKIRSTGAVEKFVKIDSQDYIESLRNKKMGEASLQDQRSSPPPIGFLKIDLHDQEQKRLSGSCRQIKPLKLRPPFFSTHT
jgi:hypothetical protein